MNIHEKRILEDLLKDGFVYITKVDKEQNQFHVEDETRRNKFSCYYDMQGNPMFGLKSYIFAWLRKGKEYKIKELLK